MSVACVYKGPAFHDRAKKLGISEDTLENALYAWQNDLGKTGEPTDEELWQIINPLYLRTDNKYLTSELCPEEIKKWGSLIAAVMEGNAISFLEFLNKTHKDITLEKLLEICPYINTWTNANGDPMIGLGYPVTARKNKRMATVAPFFNRNHSSGEILLTPMFVESDTLAVKAGFMSRAIEIREALGIRGGTVSHNLGSYVFQEGNVLGLQVTELSYLFLFDNNPKEDSLAYKLFTCLMGDLGYERLESVIYGEYVNTALEANTIEYEIMLSLDADTLEVYKALLEAGITDYTMAKGPSIILYQGLEGNNREITDSINETIEKLTILKQKLGNIYVSTNTAYCKSSFMDRAARATVYKEWLEHNSQTENRKLYETVKKALKVCESTSDLHIADAIYEEGRDEDYDVTTKQEVDNTIDKGTIKVNPISNTDVELTNLLEQYGFNVSVSQNSTEFLAKALARKLLGFLNIDEKHLTAELLAHARRAALQVSSSDAVFAVVPTIINKGKAAMYNGIDIMNDTKHDIVAGEAMYAVALGCVLGKPVFVFDESEEAWYEYDPLTETFKLYSKETNYATLFPLTPEAAIVGYSQASDMGKAVIRNLLTLTKVKGFISASNYSLTPEATESVPKTDKLTGEEIDNPITCEKVANTPGYKATYELSTEGIEKPQQIVTNLYTSGLLPGALIKVKGLNEPSVTTLKLLTTLMAWGNGMINTSKFGLRTIEITDPEAQTYASTWKKLLKYKKEGDKVTITVPASFIFGFTQEELGEYELYSALMQIEGIGPILLKNFAKATMFKLQDIINRIISEDGDLIQEIVDVLNEDLNIPIKKEAFYGNKEHIDVINAVGISNLLAYIKQTVFIENHSKFAKQCIAISENWEAFTQLGALELRLLESIALTNSKILNVANITQEAFEDNGEQDVLELFGSAIETWQIGFRLISAFASLSQAIKRRLHSLYMLEKVDGKVVAQLNEIGMPIAVDATMATASILKWTRYSTSLDEMIRKLEAHEEDNLWLGPLIKELKTTTDELFKAQFFSNFCKYFLTYAVNFINKEGVAVSKLINENEFADKMLATMQSKYELNKGSMFLTSEKNGLYNTALLNTLKDRINKLSTESTPEELKTLLEKAFNIESELSLTALLSILRNEEQLKKIKTGLLAITKNVMDKALKKTDLDKYNLFNSSNLSNYKAVLSVLNLYITSNIESVSYSDGKLHYSYVTPSYLNVLSGRLSGAVLGMYLDDTSITNDEERYLKFLQEEYGRCLWFRSATTGKWKNWLLNELAENPETRSLFKHMAVLTKDGISYVDKNSKQYASSLLLLYFVNGSNRYGWFRLPMMSNKPSEEYLQLPKVESYKINIPRLIAQTIFVQELERILACRNRAKNYLIEHPEGTIESFDKNGLHFCFLEYLNIFMEESDLVFNTKIAKYDDNVKEAMLSFRTNLNNYIGIVEGTKQAPLEEAAVTLESRLLNLITAAPLLITLFLEEHFAEYKKSLQAIGLLKVNADGSLKITDKTLLATKKFNNSKDIDNSLREFFYQDNFATMNILELTVTDKAYYKDDDDLQKRLALLHAPIMHGHITVKDFSKPELRVSDGVYRTIIFLDDFVQSEIVDNLKIAKNIILQRLKQKDGSYDKVVYDKTEQFLSEAIKAFEEVDVANALSYQTPTSLRKKLHMFGQWTNEMEEAYNKIMRGDSYGEADINTLWLPLKPFVYGMLYEDSHSSLGLMRMGAQLKNSEYTLIMADAILKMAHMPNKLQAIYDVLEATHHTRTKDGSVNFLERTTNGIDSCLFVSAFKTGAHAAIDISSGKGHGIENWKAKNPEKLETIKQYVLVLNSAIKDNEMLMNAAIDTEVTKEILKEAIYIDPNSASSGYNSDYVREVSFECYGLQLQVPEHFRHELQQGSLERILIISDTPDFDADGNPTYITINGVREKVADVKKRYLTLIADNIKLSRDELLAELHLLNEGQTILNLALSRLLQDAIKLDGRYGADALWGVTINPNTGEFNRPLSDPMQLDMIEKMLNSIIKNRICKQKIDGGPCVQVTNFGTSDELAIRYQSAEGKILLTKSEWTRLHDALLTKINSITCKNYLPARVYNHLGNYIVTPEALALSSYEEYAKTYQDRPAYYETYAPIYDESLRHPSFLDENGNIDVDKVAEANPKALLMLGYRIPTEAKYSMCPMKIVGFLPVTAGEGIMLPKELTTLSGSDFDVDKMYVMRYAFDFKEGYSIENIVNNAINSLELLKNQPRAIGNAMKARDDRNLAINTSNLSDEEKQKLLKQSEDQYKQALAKVTEHYGKKNAFISKTIRTLIKTPNAEYTGKDAAEEALFNQLKTWLEENKDKDELWHAMHIYDTKDVRKSRNNEILDISLAFLSDPISSLELFTPGGFEDVKKQAYKIAAYLNSSSENLAEFENMSTKLLKGLAKKSSNLVYAHTLVAYHKLNMVAAKLIGVFATANVSHAFMTLGHAEMIVLPTDKIFSIDSHQFGLLVKGKYGRMVSGGSFDIDMIYGFDGTRISNILALFLAASVDAVKDPVLNLLNINLKSVNIAVTMARMGFNLDTISAFFSLPSIKDCIDKAVLNDSSLKKELTKALREHQKNYSLLFNKDGSPNVPMTFTTEEWRKNLKKEQVPVAIANIVLALLLLLYAGTFKNITDATKQNSISSAVGPRLTDNYDIKENYEALSESSRVSEETKRLAYNQISRAFYESQHELANYMMPEESFITASYAFKYAYQMYKELIPFNLQTDILKGKFERAFVSAFCPLNFLDISYVTELLKQEQFRYKSGLDLMINLFPKDFIAKAAEYTKKFGENQVLEALKKGIANGYLNILLPTDNPAKLDEMQSLMADIAKNDPQLATELMAYTYARGGWGFNAKFPLAKLITTDMLKLIPGYLEQLRDISKYLPSYDELMFNQQVIKDFMVLFMLNNDVATFTFNARDDSNPTIIATADNHGTPYYIYKNNPSDTGIALTEGSIYRINANNTSVLLYVEYNPDGVKQKALPIVRFEGLVHSQNIRQVLPLGDRGNVFEYGLDVDIESPLITNSKEEDLNSDLNHASSSRPATTTSEGLDVEALAQLEGMSVAALALLDVLESTKLSPQGLLMNESALDALDAEILEVAQITANEIAKGSPKQICEKEHMLYRAIAMLLAMNNKITPEILKKLSEKKTLLNLCG